MSDERKWEMPAGAFAVPEDMQWKPPEPHPDAKYKAEFFQRRALGLVDYFAGNVPLREVLESIKTPDQLKAADEAKAKAEADAKAAADAEAADAAHAREEIAKSDARMAELRKKLDEFTAKQAARVTSRANTDSVQLSRREFDRLTRMKKRGKR